MTEKGELILAGDIGGTKTYIGLFTVEADGLDEVRSRRVENRSHDGLEGVISTFLAEGEAERVAQAVFGIACPVVENRCTLTNLDWTVDGDEIKKEFGFREFKLINDLVATAWGVDLLGGDDIHELKGGQERPGNRALLAAGTGFGQAHLYLDGEGHRPSPSEGGHADFAPGNEREVELLGFLSAKFGHVSYERILSGPGLENVYEFVRTTSGRPVPERLAERLSGPDAAGAIATEALEGDDPDCREALDIFVSVYGAEAGNMALRCLATGGVYIGGGIAPKILKALDGGGFVEAFTDKGRFRDFLEDVPVRVIVNERTALVGAAACAADALGVRVRECRAAGAAA
jgi:glucokinase